LRWQEMETDEMTRLRGTLSRKGSKQPGLTRSVLTPRHLLTLPLKKRVEDRGNERERFELEMKLRFEKDDIRDHQHYEK
ncbi:MAG: hypothetical protein PHW28_05300, partial [Mesotoga sp.]|nr:hypothetical protein [Mesotoga sp.]